MSYETILHKTDEKIATINSDHPQKLNWLRRAMTEELEDALKRAADGEVRVVIQQGAGRYYCAGFDCSQDLDHAGIDTSSSELHQINHFRAVTSI